VGTNDEGDLFGARQGLVYYRFVTVVKRLKTPDEG
jgi:hypothetical protein